MSERNRIGIILALAVAAAAASAQDFVRNPGFEDPVYADGDWGAAADWSAGWYDMAAPAVWIPGGDGEWAGAWNPDRADGFSGSEALEGDNTAWILSGRDWDGGLSQVLTTALEADTEYVLSAWVGNAFYNRSDVTAPCRLELRAGDALLASKTGASPAAGTWEPKSLTYASGPDPAGLGLPLEIRLIAAAYVDGSGIDGYEVDFDEVGLAITEAPEVPTFKRGDPNADGRTDLSDVVSVLRHLFGDGRAPTCAKSADANDDGVLDIADAVALLGYLFSGGGAPPPPFTACGADSTLDALDCQVYAPCGTGV